MLYLQGYKMLLLLMKWLPSRMELKSSSATEDVEIGSKNTCAASNSKMFFADLNSLWSKKQHFK